MQTIRLGRTGLDVSVAGLGCGGHSRLGQTYGATEAESIAVVQRALDLGVNIVDTARAYGTEEIVGRALAGRRGEVVLSTKAFIGAPGALRESLEKSLARLQTDHVDVFFLHGVTAEDYAAHGDDAVAELSALRDEGKVRFLAISERFGEDPGHVMLAGALAQNDTPFDVVMVGYSLLNPSARQRVFPLTDEHDIGVLVMFAVRRALSQADELGNVLASVDMPADALAFLGDSNSIVEAAYRFCRHDPSTHVILTGTGRVEHLETNVASINAPPLTNDDLTRLDDLFGALDTITGN